MKSTFPLFLGVAIIGISSVGCQTSAPARKVSTAKPTAAAALPAWVQKKSDRAESQQQISIQTKLMEVTRLADDAGIPDGRYQRILTDSEFQRFIREMSQTKGTDLMTAPSVVTRDGMHAAVEVIQEFAYPTTPGEGAKTEVEKVGVKSDFSARHLGGKNIALKTFTRVTEFDGYFKAAPEFELPVFKRRDLDASGKIRSGETILVGGILDEVSQDVEDTGPLGLIKKRSTIKLSRELMIAVTATLIKADGTPIAAR